MCTEEDCRIFRGRIWACDRCPVWKGEVSPENGFIQRAEKGVDMFLPPSHDKKFL